MTADALLSRLSGVKRTGSGRWIARCPAHDDKRPSLAIRELDDGRVLLHDFAGCDVGNVLAAVGLTFNDLYPERALGDHKPRERRPFNPTDVLQCVAFEALVASVAAADIAKDLRISDKDRERLILAVSRLQTAAEACHA